MASSNDVAVNAAAFDPVSVAPEVQAFNQNLIDVMSKGPKWYEVGAPKYRQMRAEGKTPFPPATLLETAQDFTIPSRDPSRSIPCRLIKPTTTTSTTPAGIFLHIHGGGWVLQDQKSQDPYLQYISNATNLISISVGYRLAPEDPYPAGPDDCHDAAEYLVRNAESDFNCPLLFIGGESAGASLSMSTTLHLLQHEDPTFQNFRFKGLLLHFGCFDLSGFTPSFYLFQLPQILMLNDDLMRHYLEVFLPNTTEEQRRDPKISSLYADLQSLRGRLPDALFTCGTLDPLLDDTVFMSSKWLMAGAEAVVKIVPGAAHGYVLFPPEVKGGQSKVALDLVEEFVRKRIG